MVGWGGEDPAMFELKKIRENTSIKQDTKKYKYDADIPQNS